MSGFVTRWPVLIHRSAGAVDCEEDGRVRNEVVSTWMIESAMTVVSHCQEFERERAHLGATIATSNVQVAGVLVGAGTVAIGAGVTEVRPTSLTVTARFRPESDGTGVANGTCMVRIEAADGASVGITNAMRDALIEMAHNATFFL